MNRFWAWARDGAVIPRTVREKEGDCDVNMAFHLRYRRVEGAEYKKVRVLVTIIDPPDLSTTFTDTMTLPAPSSSLRA